MTADQKTGELLRECPFCGSMAEVQFYKYEPSPNQVVGDDDSWSVRCTNRKCEAQPFNSRYDRQEAIDDWNRRAERNAGEAAARWRPLGLWHITADDRPTESGWLLVYFDGCIAPEAMEFDKDRGFCDPDGHFYKRHREPLAWMHMPKPPTTAARREG